MDEARPSGPLEAGWPGPEDSIDDGPILRVNRRVAPAPLRSMPGRYEETPERREKGDGQF
jgi:hypothetical protein